MARSKVKSRSQHDVAHLQPQPMILHSIKCLHVLLSKIAQTGFLGQGHYKMDKGEFKVTA